MTASAFSMRFRVRAGSIFRASDTSATSATSDNTGPVVTAELAGAEATCSLDGALRLIFGFMRGPRILIMEDDRGLGVYLRDAGCEFWRVHDCATGPPHAPPGKRAVFLPPDERASERWFVTREGVKRVYRFRLKDRRDLEPRLLMAQLTAGKQLRAPRR